MVSWLPSQNGLVFDAPQRHRNNFVSPEMSIGWPVESVSFSCDRSPPTTIEPLGVNSILIGMGLSPVAPGIPGRFPRLDAPARPAFPRTLLRLSVFQDELVGLAADRGVEHQLVVRVGWVGQHLVLGDQLEAGGLDLLLDDGLVDA